MGVCGSFDQFDAMSATSFVAFLRNNELVAEDFKLTQVLNNDSDCETASRYFGTGRRILDEFHVGHADPCEETAAKLKKEFKNLFDDKGLKFFWEQGIAEHKEKNVWVSHHRRGGQKTLFPVDDEFSPEFENMQELRSPTQNRGRTRSNAESFQRSQVKKMKEEDDHKELNELLLEAFEEERKRWIQKQNEKSRVEQIKEAQRRKEELEMNPEMREQDAIKTIKKHIEEEADINGGANYVVIRQGAKIGKETLKEAVRVMIYEETKLKLVNHKDEKDNTQLKNVTVGQVAKCLEEEDKLLDQFWFGKEENSESEKKI